MYDPFGRRIAKRDAFGVTRFVWDGNRLLCEARGQWTRTYVYEQGSFVPLARLDAVAGREDDAASCQVTYIHTDHLGTPNEVTDAQGDITWTAQYKAWGNVLRVEKDGKTVYRQTATFDGGTWPNPNGIDVPWGRVDWTSHPYLPGPAHPNPHIHEFVYDFKQGQWRSTSAKPFFGH